jgi:hypothetical protein
MAYSTTLIQQVNSPVSYPDLIGLYLGLTRFVGENNTSFLQRLYKSSVSIKDTSVKGLIDTISLNLNLELNKAISITAPLGTPIILFPGILIIGSTKLTLFNLAADTYIEWLQLSQVVELINQLPDITAELLIADTSALTLCKQTNINLHINEVVNPINLVYTVLNPGLIVTSLLFSVSTPTFTISGDSITFSSIPPTNLTISYQNITSPFTLISSDVNLISLTEPNLIEAVTTEDNTLGYQIREAIQEVMRLDRSYWTD